ncbi:hypothetical protein ANN_26244 [Periplaneta americana]|uniref:PiggyBac transposable element-derived protein domain-containing protein n=1 Tax=Periplaneta americana TaxID=6978 RepID=A0ABQ8S5V0_PERAM|nr:hypothetical protein ANN_26244 [Periplaneta americana]
MSEKKITDWLDEVSDNDLSDAETTVSDYDTQSEEEIPDEDPREILQFSTENSSELEHQPEIFAVPDDKSHKLTVASREAGIVAARKVDSSAFLQGEPAITTGPAQEPEASTLAERELERRKRRWPLEIFMALMDIASVNAHVLFTSKDLHVNISRRDFGVNLGKALVSLHIQRRMLASRLPRTLRATMKKIVGEKDKPERREEPPTKGDAVMFAHLLLTTSISQSAVNAIALFARSIAPLRSSVILAVKRYIALTLMSESVNEDEYCWYMVTLFMDYSYVF